MQQMFWHKSFNYAKLSLHYKLAVPVKGYLHYSLAVCNAKDALPFCSDSLEVGLHELQDLQDTWKLGHVILVYTSQVLLGQKASLVGLRRRL